MCGIAGLLNLDQQPASPVLVRAMTDALAHRGPDGDGIYTDGALGFGHRRLAIIDLSPGGRQPMLTQDGRYAITYNGELYNFQELRAELQAQGCRFQSRSDTEVLLQAWATWGPAALGRFNGMFAFALWDAKERRLYLARDRYGIKPLYYRRNGNVLLFGSEAKALLAHPAGSAALDLPALMEYMTFQNFFTDRTLFKDVCLLQPGCYMAVDLARGGSQVERYWDYDFREPDAPHADEAEYAEELDRLFCQAVSRQLISDVDVASYLSGGIDSGSITAVAAGQLSNLRTFTLGFDLNSASGIELGMDERREAEHMSYLFKTEQYEMVLKAGDMERCMPRLVRHLEEPRVGQSYPNFYAAQLASKFVKVVLAGSGGDELFGGYPWRYYRAVVNDDFDHYVDKYYAFWQRLVPNSLLQPMFAPVASEVKGVWTRDIFRDVFHRHADQLTRPEDYVNHSLYFEAKTFLHGLLVVEDKISMAHGLESRVPFLDNDLVDFAMRLPLSMKLGQLGEVVRLNENEPGAKTAKYFEKTRDGKLLLRKVMRRHVPEIISDGEKKGFSAPDASWFRGESIDYVKRVLGDKRARIYDYLDHSMVWRMVSEHLEGHQNRRLLIWSLLYLEQWCGTFLSGAAEQQAGDR
ncbi:asparagine synthase (glutamine-hydrolyzing) [Ferrovibrio sp.]|uniref:asparagine synthase (glutamine-hydrolyzing) n=1 Tax=Ferrovibrio sp. TaxID=1917215 RepID=UPI003D0FB85D